MGNSISVLGKSINLQVMYLLFFPVSYGHRRILELSEGLE